MNFKLTIFIIGLFFLSFMGKTQDDNCWPGFRGNQELTGFTNVELPESLELLWTFRTEDKIKSSPVICDGCIYIGSNDGKIYSLTENGELNWSYIAETSIEAPPIILDGRVYAGSLEGKLFALDAKSG